MNQTSKQIEKENLREAILNSATSLFVENGYHGVGMRDIAAASGASKALLYYHFQNKEELFLEILILNLAAVGQLVETALSQENTVRRQIEIIFQGMAAWPQPQRAMIYVAKQEARFLSPDVRSSLIQNYHHFFIGKVQMILKTGMDRAEIKPQDPVLLAQVLLGMVSPILYPMLHGEQGEESLNNILDLFFEGALLP